MSDYSGDVFLVVMENGITFLGKPTVLEEPMIGDADCLMKETFMVVGDDSMEIKDRLVKYPNQTLSRNKEFRLHSDKILTIVEPSNQLLSEYLVANSD